MTVPSSDDDTTCLRFGLNAIEVIASLWPLNDLLSAGSPTPAKNLGCYPAALPSCERAWGPCENEVWDMAILEVCIFWFN